MFAILLFVSAAAATAAMINNFGAQAFPTATSPSSRSFPPANSPGPIDLYTSGQEALSYVQATSPQPSAFGHNIAVSRVSRRIDVLLQSLINNSTYGDENSDMADFHFLW